jgi:hypothetical protein
MNEIKIILIFINFVYLFIRDWTDDAVIAPITWYRISDRKDKEQAVVV